MKFLPIAATLLAAALMSAPHASAAITRFDRAFLKADLNSDIQLTLEEFMITLGRRASWAEAKHKFAIVDTNDDNFISLVEFRETKGGRNVRRPTKLQSFRIADADQNGELTPEEYSDTKPNVWSLRSVARRFKHTDRNDNGAISWAEFGLRFNPWPEAS